MRPTALLLLVGTACSGEITDDFCLDVRPWVDVGADGGTWPPGSHLVFSTRPDGSCPVGDVRLRPLSCEDCAEQQAQPVTVDGLSEHHTVVRIPASTVDGLHVLETDLGPWGLTVESTLAPPVAWALDTAELLRVDGRRVVRISGSVAASSGLSGVDRLCADVQSFDALGQPEPGSAGCVALQ